MFPLLPLDWLECCTVMKSWTSICIDLNGWCISISHTPPGLAYLFLCLKVLHSDYLLWVSRDHLWAVSLLREKDRLSPGSLNSRWLWRQSETTKPIAAHWFLVSGGRCGTLKPKLQACCRLSSELCSGLSLVAFLFLFKVSHSPIICLYSTLVVFD